MNDITGPLRLATGSHQAGSGKGCAMNVISWETGETEITDFPACSARPLARIVQKVNDTICTTHGDPVPPEYLCPECSMTVLELGHATIGTSGATREQEAAWLAEMLDSDWGVAQYADGEVRKVITAVADLYRRRAAGNEPTENEWHDAARAALAAADAAAAAAYAAAVRADAAASAAYVTADAAASAADAADVSRVEFARQAISAWHRIVGTSPAPPEPAKVTAAIRKMQAV